MSSVAPAPLLARGLAHFSVSGRCSMTKPKPPPELAGGRSAVVAVVGVGAKAPHMEVEGRKERVRGRIAPRAGRGGAGSNGPRSHPTPPVTVTSALAALRSRADLVLIPALGWESAFCRGSQLPTREPAAHAKHQPNDKDC